ncbi:TIM-barrel domain-containing protein [Lapidilactobacillus mulanensis]|uniref:TIM-barrel domain-containing protein n=1 Tax=Lapidilactobacillus mulanensis TaxID=2485999 RepID=A0ABW4DRJ0_9LACO|nr:TIM-barrel domain-containing protein [Lapidilactobacillus mulanensis]
MAAQIIAGENYRFTIITDYLLRIEWSDDGKFEERPTYFVQDRNFATPTTVQIYRQRQDHELEIETQGFHLYYDGGAFSAKNLWIDAKYGFEAHFSRWLFGREPVGGNLFGTARTLDEANGEIPLENGVISRHGYALIDDSDNNVILPNQEIGPQNRDQTDLYYFAYGRQYQLEIKDYFKLSGAPPILPRYALGNWWSRYYQYNQQEYQDLFTKFQQENVPFSVAVLDMDWHLTDVPAEQGSGWTGYTWNESLFPDHHQLLQWLHRQGMKVTLNVHPAAGIRPFEKVYPQVARHPKLDAKTKQPAVFDIKNPQFRHSYFEDVHHPLEKEGIDFWWLDWQQDRYFDTAGYDVLKALNHYHYLDNEVRHPGEGLILSRYAGPGSQRYPIGFSGDTWISWASLKFQPYFTATASNIGYSWWSHDIGGHMIGSYDPELQTRWVQYGVFSPINRLHSSDNPFSGKEPWNYPIENRQVIDQFLQLRHQLIPYLDSENIKTHQDGVPLVQPLYYHHPEMETYYYYRDEYYFGSELLVSAIVDPKNQQLQQSKATTWIPAGTWYDFFTHQIYRGEQEVKLYRPLSEYPVLVRAGGMVPLTKLSQQNLDDLPVELVVQIFGCANHKYVMYEHQGQKIASTTFTLSEDGRLTITVEDLDHIIPSDRQIELVTLDCPELILDNQTQYLITQVQADSAPSLTDQVYAALKVMEIPFELKRQINDYVKSNATDPVKIINFIATKDRPDLTDFFSGMLAQEFRS